jgi:N-acetylglucosaminyldiphosphoundecaprenol N-acetyl-beta-D-mannosaminyltransferase
MTPAITLMGCRIDHLSMGETLGRIEEFIRSGKPHQQVVVNVDKLVKASRDEELRRIIDACALQHAGLEWFYRFLQEPRRMFRR